MTVMGDAVRTEPAKDSSIRSAWNATLPKQIEDAFLRWNLDRGTSPLHEAPTASWVEPVLWNSIPAVLKIPFPHFEGLDEAPGLKFWNGEPTVSLFALDRDSGAMLLEHCMPGTVLRRQPEQVQDEVVASLLKRLWQRSSESTDLASFRTLVTMFEAWESEASEEIERNTDRVLLAEGFDILLSLGRSTRFAILLATDLHAGNVLEHGETWRIIDPKPFVGDRTYDLVQHIINCWERLNADPLGMILRLAELAEVDSDRLRLFLFGRLAIETKPWADEERLKELIRKLAP
jgi:streptomycin 6-kinase